MRSSVGSFWFDDGKMHGAADRCHRQTRERKVNKAFFGPRYFRAGPFSRPDPPRLSSWGEGRIAPALQSTRTPLSASRES